MALVHLRRSSMLTKMRSPESTRSFAAMAGPPVPLASHLEVEWKFMPTAYLKAQLDGVATHVEYLRTLEDKTGDDAIHTRPLTFFRRPDKLIRDTYYDLDNQLANKGIWIRQRTSHATRSEDFSVVRGRRPLTTWEAKVRLGGDRIDSQFIEYDKLPDVKAVVAEHLPGRMLRDLDEVADLETHRKTWIVRDRPSAVRQGEIRIVLDQVTLPAEYDNVAQTFLHDIGEVEIAEYAVGGADKHEHEEVRRQTARSMKAELDGFMALFPSLFPAQEGLKGKLSAFFDWQKNGLT